MTKPTEFTKCETSVEVYYPDIQSVPEEDYALIRRGGLGASDASVFLGLMTKFNKDASGLVEEKLRKGISDEEKEIGKKDAIRKGKDLEDLILAKFAKLHECEKPMKPQHMYKIKDFEYLTVNFDGVLFENQQYVPVECKFVTTFGDKWYDRGRAVTRELGYLPFEPKPVPPYQQGNIISTIESRAAKVGIPPYYYTQLQQQIFGLNSTYGYLTALHDKGWELAIYKAQRDDEVIRAIQIGGYKVWQQILNRKGN